MNKTRQTVVAPEAPFDSNVIWIDTSNAEPVQKVFLNGAWIPTSAAGGDYYTKDEVDENFMGKIDDPHVGNILVMNENGNAADSTKKVADFIANPEGGQTGEVLSIDSERNPVWTTITPTGTADTEMSSISTNAVQNKVIKEYIDNNCARKDGYYSQMTVGSAENLIGQTVDSEAYLIRPTGGESNEVANGVAEVVGLEGQSCVWNQLVQNGDFSDGTTGWYSRQSGGIAVTNGILSFIKKVTNNNNNFSHNITIISGHKYIIKFDLISLDSDSAVHLRAASVANLTTDIKTISTSKLLTLGKNSIIYTGSATDAYIGFSTVSDTTELETVLLSIDNFEIIDLTLLGIDNLTTIAEVEAWLAEHVGTKPYYAYNAGTILSAQTLGIKTYGQNLLNPTTKQAKLIPYSWEENSSVYTIKNVPSGATATFTPDNTGIAVTVDISGCTLDITNYGSGILELSAATADTYICMKWDEQKDDDVVPYEEHTYDFDVRKVYGKVNGAGEYVQCFPNGMRSAGSVHDTLTASEAVVRIGSVDLGTLNWIYQDVNNRFATSFSGAKAPSSSGIVANIISSKYVSNTSYNTSTVDKIVAISTSGNIQIHDSAYTDAATFKTAMNDVPLYYELATPITYTDLVYRDGGIDTPLGEVLLQMQVNNWSMEEQLVTPYADGNPTSIPAIINTIYSIDAVEALDTLQKTAYFADDVKVNLQALLTCINTNCSETLGGTFSISETATDKVFTFSFTPNTEPDVEPTNEGE